MRLLGFRLKTRLSIPPLRGWLTVSIRAMMCVVLVIAIGLGWVVRRAHAQREAVAEIRRLHGIFTYDWRISNDRIARNSTPPGPKWLRQLVGDEPFQQVVSVMLARHQTANQTANDATLAYLEGLTGLKQLHLDGAAVTDAGLAHLRGLSSLEKLTLGDTAVTDAGLAHLRGLKALRELHLYRTKVTDAGLAHLAGLYRLQVLILESAPVSDAGMAHLARLSSLQNLNLRETAITGDGLVHFKGLKALRELKLYDTAVTDAGLANFKNLKGLTILNLANTKVTDAGLAHLKELGNLQELVLSGTKVTDAGLASLVGLKGLRLLLLDKTAVTDAGRKDLLRARPQLTFAIPRRRFAPERLGQNHAVTLELKSRERAITLRLGRKRNLQRVSTPHHSAAAAYARGMRGRELHRTLDVTLSHKAASICKSNGRLL